MERYWCHSCQQEADIDLPLFTCAACKDGFLERIGDDFFPAQTVVGQHAEQSQKSSSVQECLPDHARNFDVAGPIMAGAEENIRPNPCDDDSVRQMLRTLLDQNSIEQPTRLATTSPFSMEGSTSYNNMFGGRVTFIGGPDVVLMNEGSHDDQIPASLHHAMARMLGANRGLGLAGDLRDYAWGHDGLDNIISRLIDQVHGGAPPAPLAMVQSLPEVLVTEEYLEMEKKDCAVCMDQWTPGDLAKRLPCNHLFHCTCILPWLGQHGTCPVCRLVLDEESFSRAPR